MDDKKFIYSNYAQIVNNPYDFQFSFSTKGFVGDKVMDVDEPFVVAMSPAHAKVFYKILEKQIHDYEAVFGEINTPAVQSPKNKIES